RHLHSPLARAPGDCEADHPSPDDDEVGRVGVGGHALMLAPRLRARTAVAGRIHGSCRARRACQTHGVSVGERGAERRARLAAARVYLVCPPAADGLADLLRPALAGGVDIVQLREKHLGERELLELARSARELCRRSGALLIVNDYPLVAREA